MAKDKSKSKAADPQTNIADAGVEPKKAKKDKGGNGGGDLVGPGSTASFKAEDHEGQLLLITPLALEEEISTDYGVSDAIRADIVVLDKKKPERSEEIAGALLFQKVLQGQLRDSLTRRTRVVGTLIKDEASKKKGQSAPWRLTAPSDADIAVARSYLDALDPLR